MGVDSNLILPVTIQPDFIVYTLAKACGIEPQRYDGKENPFAARDFYRGSDVSTASYWPLTIDGWRFSLHLSYEQGNYETGAYRCAEAPVWLITARSSANNIAALRTVGERWGGRLVWRDSDDEYTDIEGVMHQMLRDPDSGLNSASPDARWLALESIAFGTLPAVVTERDRLQASYA